MTCEEFCAGLICRMLQHRASRPDVKEKTTYWNIRTTTFTVYVLPRQQGFILLNICKVIFHFLIQLHAGL